MDPRTSVRTQAHRRVSPRHYHSSSSDGLLAPPDNSASRISAGSSASLITGAASKSSTMSTSAGSAQDVARGTVGLAYGPYSYETRGHAPPSESSSSQLLTKEKDTFPSPAMSRDLMDPSNSPGYLLHTIEAEDDDALHRPDKNDQPFVWCSGRGILNFATISLLLAGLLALFIAYPIVSHFRKGQHMGAGFNIGGINSSGQVADMPGMQSLLDKETPQDAWTYTGTDGSKYNLVFSDEFNKDGRTFYPGDDAFWEGQDMHYWATGDLEWYTPDALKTKDGKLVITMAKEPTNGLNYASGMTTSWNKVCFTTGYIEVRVSLPGSGSVAGFWPGVWTMGNLGRAGFGATTDGMWPYSYDSCDLGTNPSQMDKSGNPETSLTDGWTGDKLSDLPGQRASACTCPGSDHPGPNVKVGRGVPEIDVLEGQVEKSLNNGEVSQSFQTAPFNAFVKFDNSSPATTIYDTSITHLNPFTGTALQQSLSAVTLIDNNNYNDAGYATYGFEWWSDPKNRDDGYITWFVDGKPTWKVTAASLAADPVSGVSQRLIPEEPMYLILNFGMSPSFEAQDFDHLVFPSQMFIDYVRVYQRKDVKNGVTCDPPNYPTSDYIQKHLPAYSNANLTTWSGAGYSFPPNSKYDGCS